MRSIKQLINQLDRLNQSIFGYITEMAEHKQLLKKNNEALEKLAKDQHQFLEAIVRHFAYAEKARLDKAREEAIADLKRRGTPKDLEY